MRPHGAAPRLFLRACGARGACAREGSSQSSLCPARWAACLKYTIAIQGGGTHALEGTQVPGAFDARLEDGFLLPKAGRSLLNQRWNGSRRRRLARQVGPCQRWLSGKPSRPKKAEAPSGWFPEDARSQMLVERCRVFVGGFHDKRPRSGDCRYLQGVLDGVAKKRCAKPAPLKRSSTPIMPKSTAGT